ATARTAPRLAHPSLILLHRRRTPIPDDRHAGRPRPTDKAAGCPPPGASPEVHREFSRPTPKELQTSVQGPRQGRRRAPPPRRSSLPRSEEHTSELQSPDHLVCRLLLEKKKYIISTWIPSHTESEPNANNQ